MLHYDSESNIMSIVAKDTGEFVIWLDNYLLDEGDTVYFTVNNALETPKPFIQKKITTFTDHKGLFQLTSKDTDIPVGTYYYDIEVNTADGRVDTVLGPAKFKVLGGVKY
jgi:hypothetical protein